jgi:cyclase
MLRPRITPCLLVHKGGLVKTIQFGAPKYVGDPINAVKIFNEKESDELVVLDIDATRNGAVPDMTLIGRLASECRMPLCYGGGIKTVDQTRRIIGLGVEKVAISSVAIDDPSFISAIAREIGSQSVVVVIDAKPAVKGGPVEAWTHNGTRRTQCLATDVARQAEELGAGEVVINSIDRDGMMMGYDIALATSIRQATTLPITVLGGAGSPAHMTAVIRACGVVGVSAGSLFVFKGALRAVLINYPNQIQKDDIICAALKA